jgi:hypothetical protein
MLDKSERKAVVELPFAADCRRAKGGCLTGWEVDNAIKSQGCTGTSQTVP